jgi:hypothetical protein
VPLVPDAAETTQDAMDASSRILKLLVALVTLCASAHGATIGDSSAPGQFPGATFTVAQSGSGRTVYVAPGGSDAAAGTRAQPFATMTRALQGAGPGDTVVFRGGIYNWPEGVTIDRSGAAGNWLIVRAAIDATGAPEPVAIVGNYADLDANGHCLWVSGSYVQVQNLRCNAFYGAGFMVMGGHHVRLDGNTAIGIGGGGIAVWQDPKNPGGYQIEILRNTVIGVSLRWQGATVDGGWGGGIGVFGAQATVADNEVSNVYGEGIILAGPRMRATGNVVTDVCAVGLYLDTADQTLVARNFIFTAPPTATGFASGCMRPAWNHGQPIRSTGIQVASEVLTYTGQHYDRLVGNEVRDNLVVGTRAAFLYGAYDIGDGMRRWRILNNTFVGGDEPLVQVPASILTPHADVVFANNIFYWNGATPPPDVVVPGSGGGVAFSSNLWFPRASPAAGSSSDIVADPRFVSAGGRTIGDFALQSGSPAAAAGVGARVTP